MSATQRAIGRAGALLAALSIAALSACAPPPYDPAPPRDEPMRVLRVASPLDMEATYRRLYANLEECLSGIGYHVLPRFDRAGGRAWLLVTQGLRMDRYAAFVSRFAARFDVVPDPPGARVEITVRDAELDPLADAAPAWLEGVHARCSA